MWFGTNMLPHINILLFVCMFLVLWNVSDACPPACTCTLRKQRDGDKSSKRDNLRVGRGRKVSCVQNLSPITSISQLSSLPLDTAVLNLSKNAITVLEHGDFHRLSILQKLDLSNNQITRINTGAFEGLTNLIKLDLSNNRLGSITSGMFDGMPKLEKLFLSDNRINTVPEGVFNNLLALKRIEFKSDYLRCDCHLQWIAKWAKDKNVKIPQSTTCAVPQELKGVQLKTLKKKDLHCDRPLELPLFEIYPKKSQVVFEGDKLPFECRASVIDKETRMVWLRKGDIVETNRSSGIFVHTVKSQDRSLMIHRLVLENLMKSDSGVWQCMVTTPQGNVSHNINIVVISNTAPTCPLITSKTKKGVYKWPRTVAGVISEQPCKRGKGKKATHKCTQMRVWEDLNVDQCEYIDEMTRKLQYMAAAGLQSKNLNSSMISRIAKDLKTMVSDPSLMADSTDFILATQVVELVASLVPVNEELSDIVLNIISSLMNVDATVLRQGQITQKACSRLVYIVEKIPKQLHSSTKVTKYSENIALEAMEQSVMSFQGMTCFAYFSNIFSCTDRIINQTISQENLQGSVQLPKTLFYNSSEISEATDGDDDKIDLQFILYKDPKLFPITASVHKDPVLGSKTLDVVSCVLSANISRVVSNLSEPIILTFKIKAATENIYPAYWDFNANDGLGDWRTDGCEIVSRVNNITTVHCYHLSVFAILETSSSLAAEKMKMLHLMEAGVYVGSCLCIICLMAVIITYVSCFRFINVPKKMKHSVINISVSVLLLIIGFTMGVKRTDHLLACQIVGISIHYLTLCAIFWITITSYNMLQKFTKADKPPEPPPDPVAMPLPPKPMLRFYLLGWGVPIIICGITAAVSIDHYAEPDYCFLAWDPSLGAFYGPVALLVVFNLVFFLRISCVIKGNTINNLNESDQTDDINDIEHQLDETSTEIQALTRNRQVNNNDDESDSQSIASSIMDQERRPKSQLYSVISILFLFIVFWVCGAFAVAEPFKSIIPRQELIFSYLYGFTCASFGLFMLAYFCLSRKDSCSSWRRFFCCEQQPVYDMSYHGDNDVNLANGHVVRANGSIDQNNKKYNITQDVTQNGYKESNVNLVPTNTSSVIEDSITSTPDNAKVFYNPKQNGVAKKFWDKQRHNSRLITREMTKEFNGSITDFSGSEANRTQNNGNTSDNKSHLSIEIQIQPKDLNNYHPTNSRSPLPNMQYPNAASAHVGPNSGMPVFSMLPLDRNQIPPVGGSGSPGATSPCCSTVSYCDSHAMSQNHARSPSSCSLGSRSHPSAFTPVQPKNNTLPKQNKNNNGAGGGSGNSPPSYYECMARNGSVPRLRDFDGQSHVSEACQREQTVSAHDQNQSYPQPAPLVGQNGCTYKQYGSVDDHITSESGGPGYHFHRARSHSGGFSSDASAKQRRKREQNFIQEVQQRIPCEHVSNHAKSPVLPPQNNCNPSASKSLSPQFDKSNQQLNNQPLNNKLATPDSDSGINYKRYRGNDSDHNSEPTSHSHHVSHRRHKSRSHDSHRNSRHRNIPKQKSLEWEREMKQKPKAIPYAYVNHNYNAKVRQKLQSQSSAEAKNYWGSPSIEEEDDSSSSTGDEECFDHNVWVLQNQRKQKKKKETSV